MVVGSLEQRDVCAPFFTSQEDLQWWKHGSLVSSGLMEGELGNQEVLDLHDIIMQGIMLTISSVPIVLRLSPKAVLKIKSILCAFLHCTHRSTLDNDSVC